MHISRGAYFKGAACWVCRHNAVAGCNEPGAIYCRVLASVSANSDVSGQKTCLFTTLCGFQGFTNGNTKKRSHAKIDLWMIKWSFKKLLILGSVVVEDSVWSQQAENLTAFSEARSSWCCSPRCSETPYSLAGPFPGHLLSLPFPLLFHIAVTVIPRHLVERHLKPYSLTVLCLHIGLSGLWKGLVWCDVLLIFIYTGRPM